VGLQEVGQGFYAWSEDLLRGEVSASIEVDTALHDNHLVEALSLKVFDNLVATAHPGTDPLTAPVIEDGVTEKLRFTTPILVEAHLAASILAVKQPLLVVQGWAAYGSTWACTRSAPS